MSWALIYVKHCMWLLRVFRLSTIWCLVILSTLNVIFAAIIYSAFQGLIGDSSSDATLLLDESLTSPDPHTSDSEVDDVISIKPQKKQSINSGSEDEKRVEPARKKRKIVKTEDDCTPLPDPFPLPKHFPQDVEVALKRKKLSSSEKRRFISEVASAMLRFKRYPSREDYLCVSRAIVEKYPFFKSTDAKPYVSNTYVLNLVQ